MSLEIRIADRAYQQVMYYVKKSNQEVSGFGAVEVIRQGSKTILYIEDVYLLDQKNTSAHTEISPEAMGKLECEFFQAGKTDGPRWWFHSHAKMGVFWSGEDISTINELSEPGWIVATVFNHKAEMLSAYRQAGDNVPLMINKIDTVIGDYIPEETVKGWEAEYKEKCKTDVSSTYVPSYLNRGGVIVKKGGGAGKSTYFPKLPQNPSEEQWGSATDAQIEEWAASWATGDYVEEAGEETPEETAEAGTSEEEEVDTSVPIDVYNFCIENGLEQGDAEIAEKLALKKLEEGYRPEVVLADMQELIKREVLGMDIGFDDWDDDSPVAEGTVLSMADLLEEAESSEEVEVEEEDPQEMFEYMDRLTGLPN